MPVPTTAADLQQFLCASKWIRAGLVDYARVARPFQERLGIALAEDRTGGNRSQLGLTPGEVASFEAVKELLGNSAMLTFPDPTKQLCVLRMGTCSLSSEWVEVWRTHPRATTSSRRSRTQSFTLVIGWSTCYYGHRVQALLLPQENHISFSPRKLLKKHVRGKLLRWSTKLLEYRYTIEHIETRIHSAKRFTRGKLKRSNTTRSVEVVKFRPLDDEAGDWSEQVLHTAPEGASLRDDDLWQVDGRIWVLREATTLTQRLMIVAHCGQNGHCGMHVMFSIGGLSELVRDFCSRCLLCLHVEGGNVIPRPYSETHYTYERNASLHWDFLFLGESFEKSRNALVLKDEATHFVELAACDSATSEVAVSGMLDRHSHFGTRKV
ncbi:LOW QUALITY PROTEIN: hypothetical protein PHMEG_00010553 [Phytophthora megakarya]|uniref:Integrase zinc-binding domain-containing protein n=1 Tax=Phytophthora megakarya TaxID=4795 RepID=A0A225WDF2_9STRA|nr:LOW QUALITY PROTEIN: hypothetical protein PHMEG_00010553 [Phytophthora megakarya]